VGDNERDQGQRQDSNIIPPFKILRRCLIGAGLWEMENWGVIKEMLDEVKTRNPLRGERVTLIGFDTNCFMNRIYSLMRHIYKRDLEKFGFVLSRITFLELRASQKIKDTELKSLKEKRGAHAQIIDEFWNQPTLLARAKTIGLVEFNKLKLQSNYILNDGWKIDGRPHDLQIIDDIREQTRARNYDLILLSADEQFYQISREPGVISYYLKPPYLKQMPERFFGTWELFCDFLYLLSVFFGSLSLRAKDTVQIFGVWRGKGVTEWDSESVKVQIGSQRIARLLEQQLKILHT